MGIAHFRLLIECFVYLPSSSTTRSNGKWREGVHNGRFVLIDFLVTEKVCPEQEKHVCFFLLDAFRLMTFFSSVVFNSFFFEDSFLK